MRAAVFFAVALALAALVQPASAQMCGGATQHDQAAQTGAMSCMGSAEKTQATDMFGRPAKSAGMMCACCRNMAMAPQQPAQSPANQHNMNPTEKQE